MGRKKEPLLSVVSIQTTNIAPKETVMYTKQTQTATSGHERDGECFNKTSQTRAMCLFITIYKLQSFF